MPNTQRRTSPLGELEQLVLLAILGLDEAAYGVAIREEIGEATGHVRTLGAIYKALDRLTAKGLVSSRLGEPQAVRGGRRRRFYTVEARGLAALEQTLTGLRAMSRGLAPRWRLG